MIKDQIKNEKRWLEKCQFIQQYHKEQVRLHGPKRPGKWRVEDTARELEMSIGYISESLKLAECSCLMDLTPHTRDSALQLIRK